MRVRRIRDNFPATYTTASGFETCLPDTSRHTATMRRKRMTCTITVETSSSVRSRCKIEGRYKIACIFRKPRGSLSLARLSRSPKAVPEPALLRRPHWPWDPPCQKRTSARERAARMTRDVFGRRRERTCAWWPASCGWPVAACGWPVRTRARGRGIHPAGGARDRNRTPGGERERERESVL